MNRRDRTVLRAVAPLVLMGVIFYLSAQPSAGEHAWWEVIFRKLGHVTGYALLTALWTWALQGVVRRPLLIAVCISFAYACTDELHQTFVSGRTGTPVDVGVDAIGVAIAAYFAVRVTGAPKGKRTKDAGRSPTRALVGGGGRGAEQPPS